MIGQTVTQSGADGDGILVRSRAGRDRLERGPQQATGVVRSAYTAMQHAVLFSEVRWETDVAYGSGLKTGLPSTTRWRVVDVARLASPRLPRRRQAGGGDQAAGRDRQRAAGSTLGQRRRPQCGRNVPSALVLGRVDDLVALPGFRGGGRGSPRVTVHSSPVRPPRGPMISYWPDRGAFAPGLPVVLIANHLLSARRVALKN